MATLTGKLRRLSLTASCGLVALALAFGGTAVSMNGSPEDSLGGDRLVKSGASFAKFGDLDKDECGRMDKDVGLDKDDTFGVGIL